MVPWLALAACNPATDGPPIASDDDDATQYRRLSPTELDNTLAQVLPFPVDWTPTDYADYALVAVQYPPDIKVDGYEERIAGQPTTSAVVDQIQRVSSFVASRALDAPGFLPCPLAGDEAEACGRQAVLAFAEGAWRRPLTDAEQGRVDAFYSDLLTTNTPKVATQLAVEGLLQTPQFLYLPEATSSTDGEPTTDAYALASRLAYFLWDAPPDRALLDAAADGSLLQESVLRDHASRMWDDPRARQAVVRFHKQWLHLEDVDLVRVDEDAYGTAKTGYRDPWSGILRNMKKSLEREAELFIEHTVFDGEGTLSGLLTSPRTYTTVWTDHLLGITPADFEPDPVDVFQVRVVDLEVTETIQVYRGPDLPNQRAGVLTLGGVLAVHAHTVHPSPILRGLLVLERMLCDHVDGPPPSAGSAPGANTEAPDTNRERIDAITSPPSCTSCHQRINPPGFAFEHYDALGGWREDDWGAPIDSSGSLTTTAGETFAFANAVDLAQQLSASDTVHTCYTRHWARYALGRDETPEEAPWVDALATTFMESGGRVEDLVMALVTSDAFRGHTPGGTP